MFDERCQCFFPRFTGRFFQRKKDFSQQYDWKLLKGGKQPDRFKSTSRLPVYSFSFVSFQSCRSTVTWTSSMPPVLMAVLSWWPQLDMEGWGLEGASQPATLLAVMQMFCLIWTAFVLGEDPVLLRLWTQIWSSSSHVGRTWCLIWKLSTLAYQVSISPCSSQMHSYVGEPPFWPALLVYSRTCLQHCTTQIFPSGEWTVRLVDIPAATFCWTTMLAGGSLWHFSGK